MPTSHQISFLIGAALAGGFTSSFAKTHNTVGELQKTISNLSKTSGQIENYKKLQQRITTNQAAMIDMSQKARTLSSQLKNTPSGVIQAASTSKEMNNLVFRADALQKKLDKDRESLSCLRPELVTAGVDTKI